MSVKESFVKVTEEVVPVPNSISIPNSLVTAGVVVSVSGPFEPTLIESQQQLLDVYTSVGAILPTDHITLIQAYRILATGSMVLVRSSNSKNVNAVSSLGTITPWVLIDSVPVAVLPANVGFVIHPTYAEATDSISVTISASSNPVGSFNITYLGVDYLCSLDQYAVNEFGQGIYIEYLNALGFPFQIEVIDASVRTVTPFTKSFGGIIGYSATTSASLASMTDALELIYTQETDLLDFVSDLAFTNEAFQAAVLSAADANHAQAVLSIPQTILDPSLISAYRISSGIDDDRTHWSTPFDITNNTTGFKTAIAPGTLYIERVALNKSSNVEFAPLFGKNNGRVNATKLRKVFKKADREALLTYQVNTITQDKNIFYFNDNYTGKKNKDVLSEEQNRRLVNRISRDSSFLMKEFIGEQNTTQTRTRVSNLLTTYLDNFIFNQYYRPDEYLIVCDSTNNTADMIRANKLQVSIKVRHRNAIKFIEVLNKSYAIGQNF